MTTTIIEKTKDGNFIRYLSKETKKEKAKISVYTKRGNKDIKKMKKLFNNTETNFFVNDGGLSASTVTAGDYYV